MILSPGMILSLKWSLSKVNSWNFLPYIIKYNPQYTHYTLPEILRCLNIILGQLCDNSLTQLDFLCCSKNLHWQNTVYTVYKLARDFTPSYTHGQIHKSWNLHWYVRAPGFLPYACFKNEGHWIGRCVWGSKRLSQGPICDGQTTAIRGLVESMPMWSPWQIRAVLVTKGGSIHYKAGNVVADGCEGHHFHFVYDVYLLSCCYKLLSLCLILIWRFKDLFTHALSVATYLDQGGSKAYLRNNWCLGNKHWMGCKCNPFTWNWNTFSVGLVSLFSSSENVWGSFMLHYILNWVDDECRCVMCTGCGHDSAMFSALSDVKVCA